MASHHYDLPDLPEKVDIFDTILRDGSQQEGLSLTVEDKVRVAVPQQGAWDTGLVEIGKRGGVFAKHNLLYPVSCWPTSCAT